MTTRLHPPHRWTRSLLKTSLAGLVAATAFVGAAATAASYHPLRLLGKPPPDATVSNAAVDAMRKGFEAITKGDLAAAERHFNDSIRADASLAGGYLGLAELAGLRADKTALESWLKKAVDADPNGGYTLRVWGRYLYLQGQFADAEAALKKAVAADPDALDARLNLGELQLRGQKNAKAAEQTFRDALVRQPTDTGTRLALAAALAAQARTADAEAEFERAAREAPADPEPLLALARYQASRTQFDRALKTLDRLLAAQPGVAAAHVDRGDLLLARNDVTGAMDAFRAAARAAPGRAPGAHTRLGSIYEARQAWPEAEAAYRAALKDQADHVPALNNLAYLLARRGEKLDEAERLVQRGLALSPNQPALVDTLGWVYRGRGDLQKAAVQFERAVSLAPNNAAYHYHVAVTRQEQKRDREAQASLRKALKLNPTFRDADDAKKRLALLSGGR